MIRLIILTCFLGLFIMSACERQKETTSEENVQKPHQTDMQTVYYYTCPMGEHKHIYNDKPGECPECRMELVASVAVSEDGADYYGCPMASHSHIRHDKPGKCEECGMNLKPMRLATESE